MIKTLSKPNIGIYRIGSKSEQEIHFEPCPNGEELDQLAIHDEYDLESYKFQVLNYDIEVKDALIAEALTSLTKRKRDVILLSYFMEMSDAEIARKMKLVRSTVSEHRKRFLEILKDVMEEKADESEM